MNRFCLPWLPIVLLPLLFRSAFGQESEKVAFPRLSPPDATAYLVTTLEGEKETIQDLLFSPDGQWLWGATSEGKINQWRVADWQMAKSYEQMEYGDRKKSTSGFSRLAASSRFNLLLASTNDTIDLFRVGSDQSVQKTFKGAPLSGCQLSPDESWIVASAGSSLVTIPRNLLVTANGDFQLSTDGGITTVLFRAIASISFVSNDRLAVGFEANDSVPAGTITIELPSGKRTGVEYPGALVSCSRDGRWLATDRVLVDFSAEPPTVRHWIDSHRATTVALSRDAKWFVTGGEDGRIMMWNTETMRRVATIQSHSRKVDSITISPDGRWIASVALTYGQDRWPKVWDATKIRSEQPAGLEQRIISADHGIWHASLDENSNLTLQSFDWSTTSPIRTPEPPDLPSLQIIHFENSVQSSKQKDDESLSSSLLSTALGVIAVDRTGDRRVAGPTSGVSIWQRDPELLRNLRSDGVVVPASKLGSNALPIDYSTVGAGRMALAISPNGRVMAAKQNIGRPLVHLFDANTRKLQATLETDLDSVTELLFSADNRELVAVFNGEQTKVEFWSVESRTKVGEITCPGIIKSDDFDLFARKRHLVNWSPDGNLLMIGKRVYDRRSLFQRCELFSSDNDSRQYLAGLTGVAVGPGNDWCATINKDLKIWDIDNGKPIADLPVAFARDSRIFIPSEFRPKPQLLTTLMGDLIVIDYPASSALCYHASQLTDAAGWKPPLSDIRPDANAANAWRLARAWSDFLLSPAEDAVRAHYRERAQRIAGQIGIELDLKSIPENRWQYQVDQTDQIADSIEAEFGKHAKQLFLLGAHCRALSQHYDPTDERKRNLRLEMIAEDAAAAGIPTKVIASLLKTVEQSRPIEEYCQAMWTFLLRLDDALYPDVSSLVNENAVDFAFVCDDLARRSTSPERKQFLASRAIDQMQWVRMESAEPYYLRAQSYHARGFDKHAVADLNEVLRISPEHAQAEQLRKQIASGKSHASKRDSATPFTLGIARVEGAAEAWHLSDRMIITLRATALGQKPSLERWLSEAAKSVDFTLPPLPSTEGDPSMLDKYYGSTSTLISDHLKQKYQNFPRVMFQLRAMLESLQRNDLTKDNGRAEAMSQNLKQLKPLNLPEPQFSKLLDQLARRSSNKEIAHSSKELIRAISRELPFPPPNQIGADK